MTPAAPAADDATAAMRSEVWASLHRPQKELSPKFFYDARGSALFDRITELDEYYPTRTERRLLTGFGARWIAGLGARTLVELGAGSADKTRVLLDALPAERTLYMPIDISTSYLEEAGASLAREFPGLTVQPLEADISRAVGIPAGLPAPVVVAFLGSTIGNFYPDDTVRLLRGIRSCLRADDRLLLGVDLLKDRTVLERAYNDAAGVTAEFNRNVLHVLNRQLGTDFDPDAFEHRAWFDDAAGRIEMQLVARTPQQVCIPTCGTVDIAAGEAIRTEISTKYDRAGVAALFDAAGLELEEWVADEREYFALAVGAAKPA